MLPMFFDFGSIRCLLFFVREATDSSMIPIIHVLYVHTIESNGHFLAAWLGDVPYVLQVVAVR